MFRSTQDLRRGAALIAGALALAAAAPAAADADSIAYVKDGDVWLSTADGARQHQVTTAGGYASVSQSDHGEMIALHGTRLHKLGRDGTLLADFSTPVSTGPGAQSGADGRQWHGPFDPKISPDGAKVAYHWYYRSVDGGCLPEYQTICVYLRQGTGYSRTDRLTPLDDPQHKAQTGWIYPTWVGGGSDAVVLSDPSPKVGNEDLVMHTPYPYEGTDGLTRWAEDHDVALHDGEFSRDERKMAYVAGDQHELLRIYRTPQGLHPYFPQGCYQFERPVGGRFGGPSWSPDGSKLAFSQGDGIYVADVPPLTAEPCSAGATEPRLLIPGATSADWGPADVPPARPVEQPRPPVEQPRPRPQPRTPVSRGGGQGGGGGAGGVATTPGGGRVALAATTIGASRLARSGVALRVRCARACRVSASLRVDGRTARRLRLGARREVGAARTRLAANGQRRVTVAIAPRLRARFATAARGTTLRVFVAIAPARGRGRAATRTLTLKVTGDR